MAFNPFSAKPKVDHSKVIRHFKTDFQDLKQMKEELVKDVAEYEQETAKMKEDITEYLKNVLEHASRNANRAAADEYLGTLEEKRQQMDAFMQDINDLVSYVQEQIDTVEASVEAMGKLEKNKFNSLVEMRGTANKLLKRVTGWEGELNFIGKKVKEIEAKLQ